MNKQELKTQIEKIQVEYDEMADGVVINLAEFKNLRDEFAMAALAGMDLTDPVNGVASRAYDLADAMLEARK